MRFVLSLILNRDRHVAGQSFWIEHSGAVLRYSYRVSYEGRSMAPPGSDVFAPDADLANHVSLGHRGLSFGETG